MRPVRACRGSGQRITSTPGECRAAVIRRPPRDRSNAPAADGPRQSSQPSLGPCSPAGRSPWCMSGSAPRAAPRACSCTWRSCFRTQSDSCCGRSEMPRRTVFGSGNRGCEHTAAAIQGAGPSVDAARLANAEPAAVRRRRLLQPRVRPCDQVRPSARHAVPQLRAFAGPLSLEPVVRRPGLESAAGRAAAGPTGG